MLVLELRSRTYSWDEKFTCSLLSTIRLVISMSILIKGAASFSSLLYSTVHISGVFALISEKPIAHIVIISSQLRLAGSLSLRCTHLQCI